MAKYDISEILRDRNKHRLNVFNKQLDFSISSMVEKTLQARQSLAIQNIKDTLTQSQNDWAGVLGTEPKQDFATLAETQSQKDLDNLSPLINSITSPQIKESLLTKLNTQIAGYKETAIRADFKKASNDLIGSFQLKQEFFDQALASGDENQIQASSQDLLDMAQDLTARKLMSPVKLAELHGQIGEKVKTFSVDSALNEGILRGLNFGAESQLNFLAEKYTAFKKQGLSTGLERKFLNALESAKRRVERSAQNQQTIVKNRKEQEVKTLQEISDRNNVDFFKGNKSNEDNININGEYVKQLKNLRPLLKKEQSVANERQILKTAVQQSYRQLASVDPAFILSALIDETGEKADYLVGEISKSLNISDKNRVFVLEDIQDVIDIHKKSIGITENGMTPQAAENFKNFLLANVDKIEGQTKAEYDKLADQAEFMLENVDEKTVGNLAEIKRNLIDVGLSLYTQKSAGAENIKLTDNQEKIMGSLLAKAFTSSSFDLAGNLFGFISQYGQNDLISVFGDSLPVNERNLAYTFQALQNLQGSLSFDEATNAISLILQGSEDTEKNLNTLFPLVQQAFEKNENIRHLANVVSPQNPTVGKMVLALILTGQAHNANGNLDNMDSSWAVSNRLQNDQDLAEVVGNYVEKGNVIYHKGGGKTSEVSAEFVGDALAGSRTLSPIHIATALTTVPIGIAADVLRAKNESLSAMEDSLQAVASQFIKDQTDKTGRTFSNKKELRENIKIVNGKFLMKNSKGEFAHVFTRDSNGNKTYVSINMESLNNYLIQNKNAIPVLSKVFGYSGEGKKPLTFRFILENFFTGISASDIETMVERHEQGDYGRGFLLFPPTPKIKQTEQETG